LNAVTAWSEKWLIELNLKKCKVMHIGNENPHNNYHLIDKNNSTYNLTKTTEERDLGITISSDLKWRPQVNIACSTTNKVLGMFRNTFQSKNPMLWKKIPKPSCCGRKYTPLLSGHTLNSHPLYGIRPPNLISTH